LFLALNAQVTAGLHERFYRFVYTRAVLIVLERNIDAALIASNRNHLQVAFLPFLVPSRKDFSSSCFVICVKSRCFTTNRISVNGRRIPVNQDRRGTGA